MTATIYDHTPYDQSYKQSSVIRILDLQIGELLPFSPRILNDHPIPWKMHPTQRDFVIIFRARNGAWQEDLQYRLVDHVWRGAVRVVRAGEKKEAYLSVDAKFPTQPPEWFDAKKELQKDLNKNE